MLTEERINSNFVLWCEKLKQYNVYSQEMIDEIGEELKNASFSLNESSGSAYQGSMIDTVLTGLCTIASHINNDAFGLNAKEKLKHPYLKVDNTSLMRVLLLQHISKAVMFVAEREQWKIKKGYYYSFNEELPTNLKCGERSVFMCMKYNIALTEEEYEAIRIIDKEDADKTNSFATPLSILVRIANQMVAVERYRRNLENKPNNTVE